MNLYKGPIMKIGADVNGTIYSKELVENILRDDRVIPVSEAFLMALPIGVVKELTLDGDILMCTAIINEDYYQKNPTDGYFAAMGIVEDKDKTQNEDGKYVLHNLKLITVSISFSPPFSDANKIVKEKIQ